VFKVATVQKRYNLVDRASKGVLEYCERRGIGLILGIRSPPARSGSLLDMVARRHGVVAPSQIALAWVLKRSPVMLPIPGTSKVKHLGENVAAANIKLSDEDLSRSTAKGNGRPSTSNRYWPTEGPLRRARGILTASAESLLIGC
jgi:pyridoxine 4-dehydrogenase